VDKVKLWKLSLVTDDIKNSQKLTLDMKSEMKYTREADGFQVHAGKTALSQRRGMPETEKWIASRSLAIDDRNGWPKLLAIEFKALSDPKRRMHLGLPCTRGDCIHSVCRGSG
jgi:hypothetical protein